jgi:hypothetical protein
MCLAIAHNKQGGGSPVFLSHQQGAAHTQRARTQPYFFNMKNPHNRHLSLLMIEEAVWPIAHLI